MGDHNWIKFENASPSDPWSYCVYCKMMRVGIIGNSDATAHRIDVHSSDVVYWMDADDVFGRTVQVAYESCDEHTLRKLLIK